MARQFWMRRPWPAARPHPSDGPAQKVGDCGHPAWPGLYVRTGYQLTARLSDRCYPQGSVDVARLWPAPAVLPRLHKIRLSFVSMKRLLGGMASRPSPGSAGHGAEHDPDRDDHENTEERRQPASTAIPRHAPNCRSPRRSSPGSRSSVARSPWSRLGQPGRPATRIRSAGCCRLPGKVQFPQAVTLGCGIGQRG